MSRTITVKGIGRVTAKPDTVILSLSLESRAMDYEKAMEIAADSIEDVTNAVISAGFKKDAVKTTDFNVRTDYENVEDRRGYYRKEFRGYVVSHDLKVEFGLDMKLLSRTLSAIAGCHSRPQLSISFVVKDAAAVNEEMLRSAAENARKKAQILCDASGVTLGKILSIDYNWGEIDVCSDTRYSYGEAVCLGLPDTTNGIDIDPDDIEASDTATFVWEID